MTKQFALYIKKEEDGHMLIKTINKGVPQFEVMMFMEMLLNKMKTDMQKHYLSKGIIEK